MPWRLIQFIIIFTVFLLFITFNLDHKSDIHFGFTKIVDVPVYLTVFISFICGIFFSLFFVYVLKPRKRADKSKKPGKKDDEINAASGHYGID